MPLLLLDIDGTLLRTRGAGRTALDHAFVRVHGWEDATEGVEIAGATDAGILNDVGRRFGVVDHDAVREAYLQELARLLREPGRAAPIEGVHAALPQLGAVAELALLTGNWRVGAALKLAAAGLPDFGLRGAFGDDSADRGALVPVARERCGGWPVEEVVILGDTPGDIACARAGGARVIVVETGFASASALRSAGPDLQVADLESGLDAVLALLTR